MNNVSIERLIEIEDEREQTMADKRFQKWFRELNVSRVYKDKEPLLRARDMMKDYDYSIKIDLKH